MEHLSGLDEITPLNWRVSKTQWQLFQKGKEFSSVIIRLKILCFPTGVDLVQLPFLNFKASYVIAVNLRSNKRLLIILNSKNHDNENNFKKSSDMVILNFEACENLLTYWNLMLSNNEKHISVLAWRKYKTAG